MDLISEKFHWLTVRAKSKAELHSMIDFFNDDFTHMGQSIHEDKFKILTTDLDNILGNNASYIQARDLIIEILPIVQST